MKEELTTKMHMEFCRNEEERLELSAMAAYAEMRKGKTKKDALKDNDITEEEYEKYKP